MFRRKRKVIIILHVTRNPKMIYQESQFRRKALKSDKERVGELRAYLNLLHSSEPLLSFTVSCRRFHHCLRRECHRRRLPLSRFVFSPFSALSSHLLSFSSCLDLAVLDCSAFLFPDLLFWQLFNYPDRDSAFIISLFFGCLGFGKRNYLLSRVFGFLGAITVNIDLSWLWGVCVLF